VRSGPYRVLRHPSYTGLLLAIFGLSLRFANLAAIARWRNRFDRHCSCLAQEVRRDLSLRFFRWFFTRPG
jgi:hypothetical protein